MVVNCPNCECPNDADIERCRQCGARIPWAMRQRAVVPKKAVVEQKGPQYDQVDVQHQSERARTMHKTSDDVVGRRNDIGSLRGELKQRDTGIAGTSPSDRYSAPPPTQQTAARTSSGRAYVDNQAYQQQMGRSAPAPTAAPNYQDRAAWEAAHGTGYNANEARQALAASAASHSVGVLQNYDGNPAPTPGHAPAMSQADAARWRANQLSVPSDAQTAAALAASASGDPMAALNAATGGSRNMPPPPVYQQAMPAPPPPTQSYSHSGSQPRAQYSQPPPQYSAAPPQYAAAPPQYAAAPPQYAAAPPQYAAAPPQYAAAPAPPYAAQSYSAVAPNYAGAPAAAPLAKAMTGESSIGEPDPATTAPATLIFLDEHGRQKERLPLQHGKTVIGRSEGEVLLRGDAHVSPWHAQLSVKRTGVEIKDMYSLNGVYLRINRQALLKDKDRFIIGRQVIKFHQGWTQASPDEQGTRPLGGPNPLAVARVLVLTESGELADQRLIRETLTIGRSGCDLNIPEDDRLPDKAVQIQRDRDSYILIDLGSPEGIFLAIRGEAELKDGDTIQIGRQRLMLESK
ncbi:MAG: hypothetical protein CO108_28165 [Deltaproteobacteria bacterium CG_4_9_14_3_um_filter_63_12]|nr:MAG: hypothetical protein CO108_28165 [Deltaproteobacteria bacterium CG_4_9_14_3_um_filter_63_12]